MTVGPGIAERMLVALAALPGQRFAVLDGARFDDLPGLLAARGLGGRGLFREGGAPAALAAGPRLVLLGTEAAARAVLDLALGRSAVVFWSWDGDGISLFNHLRRINMVEIPRDAGAGAGPGGYEAVLLRHADPAVMADLLPLLDGAQVALLFRQAHALLLEPAAGQDRPRTYHRPANLPPPATGRLRITPAQYDMLGVRRMAGSRRNVAEYLIRHAHPARPPSWAEAERIAQESEASGRELGLHGEAARARWAFLMMATEGRVAADPDVRHLLTRPGGRPERDVSQLMDFVVDGLRRGMR